MSIESKSLDFVTECVELAKKYFGKDNDRTIIVATFEDTTIFGDEVIAKVLNENNVTPARGDTYTLPCIATNGNMGELMRLTGSIINTLVETHKKKTGESHDEVVDEMVAIIESIVRNTTKLPSQEF